MKHKKLHKPAFDPEQYRNAEDSIIQIRKKTIGLAFLIVGSVLVIVSFLFARNNTTVADYVVSIFMQFLPGVILILSAAKVLLSRE